VRHGRAVGLSNGRGASSGGAAAVPTGVEMLPAAAPLVAVAIAAGVGAVVGMTVEKVAAVVPIGVPTAVVASANVGDGAIGMRVPADVARTLGLGVRKSYDKVPTRCGVGEPGVNVGSATRLNGAWDLTGKIKAAKSPKTT
jgi:hypothetical protein